MKHPFKRHTPYVDCSGVGHLEFIREALSNAAYLFTHYAISKRGDILLKTPEDKRIMAEGIPSGRFLIRVSRIPVQFYFVPDMHGKRAYKFWYNKSSVQDLLDRVLVAPDVSKKVGWKFLYNHDTVHRKKVATEVDTNPVSFRQVEIPE